MRIAHVAICTPRRCGLYETTRELVAAERVMGIDARLVDPAPVEGLHPGPEDRGVPVAGMDWAVTADVIASHSGHDGTPLEDTDQPVIHVAHGRPLSSFLGERAGEPPAYSYGVARSRRERYRACATFWPEHEPVLRVLWAPKPVRVVTAPCDASYWCPGSTAYDFAGKAGTYNVVCADPWVRNDANPFHVIHAFALFRRDVPGARLHVYAHDGNLRGWGALSTALGDSLGVVQGWAADLRGVYRAAQMLITPHRIYTRSIREAMACGCQVVSGRDCCPEDVSGFAEAMFRRMREPQDTALMARGLFSPARSAVEFVAIAREAARADV